MTTHPTTGRPVTEGAAGHYIHRDHTVTGTATQLANIVANHRNAGTLIALTAPRPITGDRFQLVIRLREYQPTQPATRVTSAGEHARTRIRRSRRSRIAVITTVTGVTAGTLTVAAYLLGQLVAFIAAHAAILIGALALIALLALAGSCAPGGTAPAVDHTYPTTA
jgi:hypothetical protein